MAPDEAVAVPSRAGSSREAQTMTDKTIDLDGRRGIDAQKATDLRRLLAEVEANERRRGALPARPGEGARCDSVGRGGKYERRR
jgi:hypothetical protein